jgi:hypothetical protein
MSQHTDNLDWETILQHLSDSPEVSEGYGNASRHLVTIPDGPTVFVKQGSDDETIVRIQKELFTYDFLNSRGFLSKPELIATSPDKKGFALEALTPETGWDWTGAWTNDRLIKTLEAMDVLAAIIPQDSDMKYFGVSQFNSADAAWEFSADTSNMAERLKERMGKRGYADLAENIDLGVLSKLASTFIFENTALVHNDVRRDNCAWNAELQEVKLIDWDWVQIGDRNIDVNALLVTVHKSGFDVTESFQTRLDGKALLWLANFWFKNAATPIWLGGNDKLRDLQLDAAITAYDLGLALVNSKN